jgi:hypothetical protein
MANEPWSLMCSAMASTGMRKDANDSYATSSSIASSSISTPNIVVSVAISAWMCSACGKISSDWLCKMTNVKLTASMAGDTANVVTHHALVSVCSGRFVVVNSTSLRRFRLKKVSRRPR